MDYAVSNRTVFAVPTDVVDHFLKLAPPEALKVLLYVLRHSGTVFSGTELAAALALPPEAVEEAFAFWEQANVLTIRQEASAAIPVRMAAPAAAAQLLTEASLPAEASSLTEAPLPAEAPSVPETSVAAPPAFAQRSSAGFLPRPSELAARIDGEERVRMLFAMSEQLLQRPLNSTEHRSLLWMLDYLGLNPDVILMLLGYGKNTDKTHLRYLEAIAVRWQEEGITSLTAAQEEVRRMTERQSFTAAIMRIFEMPRRPVAKQQEFINLWQTRGYSLDLITYAYEKTIYAIEKLSFPYISRILESWDAAGLTDRAAVDAMDEARPKQGSDGEAHSYDLEGYKELVNPF